MWEQVGNLLGLDKLPTCCDTLAGRDVKHTMFRLRDELLLPV